MIDHLKLEHFKAFRDVAELSLNGKNALVFGENGAGKSSLYQALKIIYYRQKIFAEKIDDTVTDPLVRQNEENDILATYNYQQTPLTNFSLEINGGDYKAFPTTGYDVSLISQDDIKAEDRVDVTNLIERAFINIDNVTIFIKEKRNTIETVVNSLLKNNFCEEYLTIKLHYQEPRWILTIKDSSRDKFERNERLTEYFNEAKLHIIKLLLLLISVQYNGAKERGNKRIIILDDVLTSMDAANRTIFIKLLAKYFDEYQKIVLTHSVSFFNLAEHSFSVAYQQTDKWKLFQILEHPGNSVIEEREPQDNAFKINKDLLRGASLSTIGNRVRKHFEYLVRETSQLLYTGGLSETGQLLSSIMSKKKLYYYFDTTDKKLKTVYDLIEELTTIIDAAPTTPLKLRLSPIIAQYASGTELEKLRDILCEMVMYQKVSMHPLSHSTGALPLTTQRECERSVSLLIQMEKQLGALIGRDMYSN